MVSTDLAPPIVLFCYGRSKTNVTLSIVGEIWNAGPRTPEVEPNVELVGTLLLSRL